jgi:hypothetical protein
MLTAVTDSERLDSLQADGRARAVSSPYGES